MAKKELLSQKQLISIIGTLLMVLSGIIWEGQLDMKKSMTEIQEEQKKHLGYISWITGKMGDRMP
jgi:hypothetical protein